MDWGTVLLLVIFGPMVVFGLVMLFDNVGFTRRMADGNRTRDRVRRQKEEEMEDEIVEMVEDLLTEKNVEDLTVEIEEEDKRRKRKRKVRPMEDEYI